MDIKLVPYADKVAGSQTAAGQVSADDLNQIKKILNAIVQALFTLDGNGVATTGIVKLLALPDIDLIQYFSGDFVVSGGLIANAGGGTALPAAAAPTNFIVDDVNNTAAFTPAAGTMLTDYQISFNGGTSYSQISANPVYVGDVALAAGTVKIRAKATPANTASVAITNATAYTASGAGNPDAGFIKADTTGFSVNNAWNKDAAPNDNTLHYFNGNDGGNSYNSGSNILPAIKIANGSTAEIRWNINMLKDGFWLGLSSSATDTGGSQNSLLMAVQWQKATNTSGKFQLKPVGSGGYSLSPVLTPSVAPRFRIRLTGVRIYAEYSQDGGTSWTDIAATSNMAQPAQDLYIHCYGDYYTSDAVNIIQSGMIPA